ncbi:MAG: ribonuclease E/G [Eubacterium sp.]|nr:ribonuclease E/G [Eubacterium sp.]MDD7210172.1 ribonuclease E/G [Lachnospiraceae bacterium]MDY5497437.1 ribonuclease E/G [Anaerobutyricum sp.]
MDKKNNYVITKKDGIICYGYFNNGIPCELYCEPEEQESIVGNIYVARVERIAEGIGGAFLEIGKGEECYLPFKKICPIKLSPGPKDKICGGDLLLVQITKDAVKKKLPVADGNVSLNGKYFVFTLTDKRSGISKKIKEETERNRLLNIAKPYKTADYGIVVRTNAKEVSEECLTNELEHLRKRYEKLMKKAAISPGKTLLYKESPHYISLIKELPSGELSEIITDQEVIYERVKEYISDYNNGDEGCAMRLYQDDYSLFHLYRFAHFYEQAYEKTVWLKSGGSLVIEHTEAMTVIDVNTGSVIKKKKQSENLFYQINCEAAEEIARQIRLRNLSGIILIDFINMKEENLQKKLMSRLDQECRKDRIRCTVIDMTALNLVEMTRNKVRRPLYEQIRLCRTKNRQG